MIKRVNQIRVLTNVTLKDVVTHAILTCNAADNVETRDSY